jgi:hypothetical protein
MSASRPASFDARPWRLAMGLRACSERAWLDLPPDHDDLLAERTRLLAERHDEVFAALPGAETAAAELMSMVVAHRCRAAPERFVLEDDVLLDRARAVRIPLPGDRHPLDTAGRITVEDLCLMAPPEPGEPAGAYRLAAASLCFPTRWRLADKLGRPLRGIHAPVDGFETELASPVERLFATLPAERIVERANWSILDDPTLFQPGGHTRTEPSHDITAANAGDRLVLRTERQTLRRLPASGWVLFTIRIRVVPLAEALTAPADAAGLAMQLRSMPAEHVRYKSLLPFMDVLLAYADARAAVAPGATVRPPAPA